VSFEVFKFSGVAFQVFAVILYEECSAGAVQINMYKAKAKKSSGDQHCGLIRGD
jgi:hypothetical protein